MKKYEETVKAIEAIIKQIEETIRPAVDQVMTDARGNDQHTHKEITDEYWRATLCIKDSITYLNECIYYLDQGAALEYPTTTPEGGT